MKKAFGIFGYVFFFLNIFKVEGIGVEYMWVHDIFSSKIPYNYVSNILNIKIWCVYFEILFYSLIRSIILE